MSERILRNTLCGCVLIFSLLLAAHCAEVVWIRTDESVFGENFLNKLFGIAVLWLVLRLLGWSWADIGFGTGNALRFAVLGAAMGAGAFFAVYALEALILTGLGRGVRLEVFTTGFSLTGEAAVHTGAGYILLCVLLNIVNLIMEEGTFRGLFLSLVKLDHSAGAALIFQALLFGLWHVVTPLRGFMDGDMGAGAFIGLSIGYIVLAGLMGIKWGLLHRLTGSLYAGMSDHFINNCIGTNLLHLVSSSGTDELQIIRVALAQLLSFALVCLVYYKTVKSGRKLE